jgi:hypothetical protein
MKHKFMYLIGIVTLLGALATIITLLVWSLYDYKPLKINKEPMYVLTEEVKSGDILIYQLDYCKFNEKDVLISRSFVDGIIFTTPTIKASNQTGCRIINISVSVPETLPNGRYYLKVDYTYKVNPIREVTVTSYTEKFTVVDN